MYAQTGADQHGGTPYFRIFTNDGTPSPGGDHAVVFSTNTQNTVPNNPQTKPINSGVWQNWVVTDGSVRYDDDAGNAPDMTWNQLITQHGTDKITQIRIQAGC